MVLVTLMYLPWLLGPFGVISHFPIIFDLLFILVYFIAAVALPIWFYFSHRLSRAHGIVFYASLSILLVGPLFTFLLTSVTRLFQ